VGLWFHGGRSPLYAVNIYGFTNAKERRIYVSVVTLGQQRDRYSVMVEVYRHGDSDFPFEIAVDQQGLRLPEVLNLFARFLEV